VNGSDDPAGQLAQPGTIPLLRPWLQGRQRIVGEPFESFVVGSSRTPTTVESVDADPEGG
jgi:hypothetical protein